MKKLLICLLFLSMTILVHAETIPQTNIDYFYSTTCSHCANVAESGILEKVEKIENVNIRKYEVSENRELFIERTQIVSAPQSIPLAVIETNGKYQYLLGDRDIIEKLEQTLEGNSVSKQSWFEKLEIYLETKFLENVDQESGSLTFLGIMIMIIIALIDAINPCAFGVLLFLMAGLLSMGSSKRAFRAGMIYSFVIFLAYLTAGFLITQALASFSGILSPVLIGVGILVFIGGLIEIKDFFWYGKGFSLKIPASAKPKIEQLIHRGTLPAILILGVLVALVELPCTGGVYLIILSIMAKNNVFGLGYLILYNFIFVLPLIMITFLISRGANIDAIKVWVENNKRLMRLAAGLVMILLATYLIISA